MDDIEYNLMVSARFPFEYQTPVRYPILYMSVYMAFSYSSTFVLLNDLIMQAHLMHLLCQYNILCNCFESIMSDCLGENGKNQNQLHTVSCTQQGRQIEPVEC